MKLLNNAGKLVCKAISGGKSICQFSHSCQLPANSGGMAMRINTRLATFAAIAAFVGSAAGAGPAVAAGGPSFSCARASAADERAICRSPALRAADARMASLYRDIQGCTMMGGHGDNIDLQRAWLARRSQCGGNTTCLARLYRARIAEFAPMAARARRFMQVEECPGPLR